MGWWKQEVATKVVTNKVLNGGEQLPLSAFQHLALEAGLEYPRPPPPFEWQVPLAGLPSLGLKPERPRPSSRSLGGGPPGATWCTRSWMRELKERYDCLHQAGHMQGRDKTWAPEFRTSTTKRSTR